ncbi:UbiA family prenyltransferase [Nonomuraea sp. FMUSA5-5]|uniref:UbiA family prenyltransferase n=1 Tax=Nonomuraea composti TaxID=2720023 RepID=A0ABX1BLV1_9ACTN|nr:UbiA family prenyltransferase [Nonomuraea sp. FMUSA5-5]NJP97967.1 UbiA family prenyltransferase [Nonomuraea sp. FMUSA5-5]
MTALRDLLELVRAPAALSVPGDVAAGAAAGQVLGPRTVGLACSSVCLYWAGMAANDWADRHLDATERPERPIPSGRVSPGTALGVAVGLTAAGLTTAALAGGRRALAVAVPLAGAIWAYDLAAKNTRAGPLVMAACRGLDVLLGATAKPPPQRRSTPPQRPTLSQGLALLRGLAPSQRSAPPRSRASSRGPALLGRLIPASPVHTSPADAVAAALPAALTIAVHTYLLTHLSQGETSGTARRRPAATLAGTVALATATACQTPGPASPGPRRDGAVAARAVLAAWYASQFGAPQARAVAEPSAERVREAVAAGIVSLPALQGALVARAGAPRAGLALAAMVPPARRLARKLSPT